MSVCLSVCLSPSHHDSHFPSFLAGEHALLWGCRRTETARGAADTGGAVVLTLTRGEYDEHWRGRADTDARLVKVRPARLLVDFGTHAPRSS